MTSPRFEMGFLILFLLHGFLSGEAVLPRTDITKPSSVIHGSIHGSINGSIYGPTNGSINGSIYSSNKISEFGKVTLHKGLTEVFLPTLTYKEVNWFSKTDNNTEEVKLSRIPRQINEISSYKTPEARSLKCWKGEELNQDESLQKPEICPPQHGYHGKDCDQSNCPCPGNLCSAEGECIFLDCSIEHPNGCNCIEDEETGCPSTCSFYAEKVEELKAKEMETKITVTWSNERWGQNPKFKMHYWTKTINEIWKYNSTTVHGFKNTIPATRPSSNFICIMAISYVINITEKPKLNPNCVSLEVGYSCPAHPNDVKKEGGGKKLTWGSIPNVSVRSYNITMRPDRDFCVKDNIISNTTDLTSYDYSHITGLHGKWNVSVYSVRRPFIEGCSKKEPATIQIEFDAFPLKVENMQLQINDKNDKNDKDIAVTWRNPEVWLKKCDYLSFRIWGNKGKSWFAKSLRCKETICKYIISGVKPVTYNVNVIPYFNRNSPGESTHKTVTIDPISDV